MSKTAASLRHKIDSASDLKGVVRTMKVLAASSISQYEEAVKSLSDYYYTVEVALGASLRVIGQHADSVVQQMPSKTSNSNAIHAIVLGSDQGLVGQFNEDMTKFVLKTLSTFKRKAQVWVVGEQVLTRLSAADVNVVTSYTVPSDVNAIASLVGELLLMCKMQDNQQAPVDVYVFYNQSYSYADESSEREDPSVYKPHCLRLLPLDKNWFHKHANMPWPTPLPPEVLCTNTLTLRSLISEYLFISLFRACAESLANENASRLAAMQRAEKNIDELLSALSQSFHGLRQSAIDEELNDVLAGYESLPHA